MTDQQKNFSIRYDQSEISYITQFLVSPGNEEVLLDLSSGLLNESQTKTLPIQSRIALPWSTVERLASVLNRVVAAKRQQSGKAKPKMGANIPTVPQASLPQMTQ